MKTDPAAVTPARPPVALVAVRTGYAWAEIVEGGGALREEPALAFWHAHAREAR